MTGPKRFYKTVDMDSGKDGFAILLDGKPVSTPARAALAVASEAVATEIAREWAAQGEKIAPETMPMTKRANTALDRVRGREAAVVADIVSYAATDLVCYRADAPEGLVAMQCEHWDPVIAWAKDELGATFETQTGVTHVEQPAESLKIASDRFSAFDFYELTPLHTMTTLTGSALLTLAHASGSLAPETVWAAAHVDEDWQISKWGDDDEASARRARRRAEFDDDVRFLELLRAD